MQDGVKENSYKKCSYQTSRELRFYRKAACGKCFFEWDYFFCTLSLSDGQMVIDKKRMATTGSKHTATVKMMVNQMYGCLRAFEAVPVRNMEIELQWSFHPKA